MPESVPSTATLQHPDPTMSSSQPDSLPEPFLMSAQDSDSVPVIPAPDTSPLAPARREDIAKAEDPEDDEDFEDETLAERLWGLTEMFPESVRNVTGAVVGGAWVGGQTCFSLGKSALWVMASSAAILALPVMFETERAQMEEQQIQQQRQILLGPNAAVSGGGTGPGGMGLSPGSMPQVVPPGAPQPR